MMYSKPFLVQTRNMVLTPIGMRPRSAERAWSASQIRSSDLLRLEEITMTSSPFSLPHSAYKRSQLALLVAATLVGVLGVCGATAANAAPVDLGTLQGGSYSSARAINGKGQVVGNALDGITLTYRQFLWKKGQMSEWSACCSGGLGVPVAINGDREAAGYFDGGFDTYPVYWSAKGHAMQLPPLPGGNGRGAARDINDAGLVAGYTRDGGGNSRHAVLWNRTELYQDLGFMGEPGPGLFNQSLAYGLNNVGEVVGASLVGNEFHAFVWRAGSFTDLGPGSALDITDSGLVMGYAPGMIPVFWRGGLREYLPHLDGSQVAYGHFAVAMNQLGDVVGYAPARKAPYQDTAVLWRGGQAWDLGRFPGGTVSRAFAISDQGKVVGEGNLVPDGPMHALRWTIKPGQAAIAELE
jgi:probable HAF family extracellular repeat protein